MRYISAGLREHLEKDLTSLSRLLKITRVDGVVIGLTSHDVPLLIEGIAYQPQEGFKGFTFSSASGFGKNSFSFEGVLSSELITEDALSRGYFDYARIDLSICNWSDLSQGVCSLARCFLGAVSYEQGQYKGEVHGFHVLLTQRIGQAYTPECRFDFGSSQCGYDCSALVITSSVTSAGDALSFGDYMRDEATGTFNDAILTWTSGSNTGHSQEVYKWDMDTQMLTLWAAPPVPYKVGDGYSLARSCDKRFSTCRDVYDNVANFGGFPHLPGIGKILDYPDAR